jgi:hypothetical protein
MGVVLCGQIQSNGEKERNGSTKEKVLLVATLRKI